MTAVLKIVDKQLGKQTTPAFALRLASERITARELIRRRVRDEIRQLTEKSKKVFTDHERTRSFLIAFDPESPEARLNPFKRTAKPKRYDEDTEVGIACEAFEQNRFMLLFDDTQVDDLDKELIIKDDSEVVFLRLTPLIGG